MSSTILILVIGGMLAWQSGCAVESRQAPHPSDRPHQSTTPARDSNANVPVVPIPPSADKGSGNPTGSGLSKPN